MYYFYVCTAAGRGIIWRTGGRGGMLLEPGYKPCESGRKGVRVPCVVNIFGIGHGKNRRTGRCTIEANMMVLQTQ
jgi:hypothetical protein